MLPLRSDAGRQSRSTHRPSGPPPAPVLSRHRPKTPERGMVGGENFSPARPHGGDAIVRARLDRE
eukprot:484885-Pleurochrysis_carterae.AAC.1